MDLILRLLLVQLRSMQLFYHNCHNLTKGQAFFGDHPAFNDFYSEIEDQYDSVVERAIGLYHEPLDLSILLPAISKNLEMVLGDYNTPEDMLNGGLALEKELIKICDLVEDNPMATLGTKNLIAGIADSSEIRSYKLNQRLKKDQSELSPIMSKIDIPIK
jgi:DNA-binding ferritin-like protein